MARWDFHDMRPMFEGRPAPPSIFWTQIVRSVGEEHSPDHLGHLDLNEGDLHPIHGWLRGNDRNFN